MDGCGLCSNSDDINEIIVGKNPPLIILIHEMGHLLLEYGHNEEHKRIMLEIYNYYKREIE
jgi:hypothetical protein